MTRAPSLPGATTRTVPAAPTSSSAASAAVRAPSAIEAALDEVGAAGTVRVVAPGNEGARVTVE